MYIYWTISRPLLSLLYILCDIRRNLLLAKPKGIFEYINTKCISDCS